MRFVKREKINNYQWAVDLQNDLARQRKTKPLPTSVHTIAGADAAYSSDGKYCIAAVLLFSYPDMKELECSWSVKPVDFPYIPGFLSFRETPAITEAARKLTTVPDVLLIDGQGYAHPRRFGLACHVGVELNLPTIGCAKSRLVGTHRDVGEKKGSVCRLMDKNERIGVVVRTRDRVKCLYVSEGHLCSLDQAVKLVLRSCRGYRLPEPTRLADRRVAKLKQELSIDKPFQIG